MVAEAETRFGRIDLLVNNAAIRLNRNFGDFTAAEFDKAVAVNLRAPFLASQAVLPSMRRQGGGRIVHVASQLGSVAYQTRTIYGMTKAALIHLAKSMALELARENIQVNTVSPGPIATQPLLDRARDQPEESARRMNYVPMGRFGRPEEIGEVVHWLLTTDASFLTGQDLIVDGGYTIH
jgi:NAD(P)-dependent dehydrogenase (short-subunit alcohol dehydrogenase family)